MTVGHQLRLYNSLGRRLNAFAPATDTVGVYTCGPTVYAALNILPADEYPRATAYVDQMIEFAADIERHGYAYTIDSGLYFDTTKSPGYGSLGLINTAGQREGARVEQVEGRRNKTDFALWRTEVPGQMRAMRWKSPWGWGAPGWHLECSVRFWLHNEFLQFGAQKMAKSAGGTIRVADLCHAGLHPMAYRLFLASGHYRAQLDYTQAAIDASQATLRRLLTRIRPLRPLPKIETLSDAREAAAGDTLTLGLLDRLDAAISDDLGTPQVLALLQNVLRPAAMTDDGRRVVIAACDALLGIGLTTLQPEDLAVFEVTLDDEQTSRIEDLLAQRQAARKARDWERADQLRAELNQIGVQVTDTSDGTVWSTR